MVTRQIIKIDEEKCDGCGMCVPACAEGALRQIVIEERVIGITGELITSTGAGKDDR